MASCCRIVSAKDSVALVAATRLVRLLLGLALDAVLLIVVFVVDVFRFDDAVHAVVVSGSSKMRS